MSFVHTTLKPDDVMLDGDCIWKTAGGYFHVGVEWHGHLVRDMKYPPAFDIYHEVYRPVSIAKYRNLQQAPSNVLEGQQAKRPEGDTTMEDTNTQDTKEEDANMPEQESAKQEEAWPEPGTQESEAPADEPEIINEHEPEPEEQSELSRFCEMANGHLADLGYATAENKAVIEALGRTLTSAR